jgi:hypothetical protein
VEVNGINPNEYERRFKGKIPIKRIESPTDNRALGALGALIQRENPNKGN